MKTTQERVDEFDEFAQINDLYQMGFPFCKHKAWLTKQLTEAVEEARKRERTDMLLAVHKLLETDMVDISQRLLELRDNLYE